MGEGGASEVTANERATPRSPQMSQDEMLEAERSFIWPDKTKLPAFQAGLALSGGGVRAATVALGVLQALAAANLLSRFHYLSTVSGGGYIGTSLSWFWCRKRYKEERRLLKATSGQTASELTRRKLFRYGASAETFPFQDRPTSQVLVPETVGPSKPKRSELRKRQATANLEFLRNHGSYLTTGDGIGFAGLAIAVLRTVLLSLVVWLPLLVVAFLIVEKVDASLRGDGTPPKIALANRPDSKAAPRETGATLPSSTSQGATAQPPSEDGRPQPEVKDVDLTAPPAEPPSTNMICQALICSAAPFAQGSPRLGAWTGCPAAPPVCTPAPTKKVEQSCVGGGAFVGLGCRPTYVGLLFFVGGIVVIFILCVVTFSILGRWQPETAVPGLSRARRFGPGLAWLTGAILAFGSALKLYSLGGNEEVNLLVVAVLGMIAFGLFAKGASDLINPTNPGYLLRRWLERVSSEGLPVAIALAFIGSLPALVASLAPSAETTSGWPSVVGPFAGVFTLLSGVGTALYGYYLKAKSILPGFASQAFATAGALVFLAGLLIFAFVAAGQLYTLAERPPIFNALFPILFVTAVGVGWCGSVNATGLNRFYRDRLMETFMPMTSAVESGTARRSNVADNLSLVDMSEPNPRYPYHIINAHAILTRDESPKVALRGGDNFILSAAIVGSKTTGWVRTRDFASRYNPMTLATAMATSGAAANANAGYTGTGITRDRFVSAVMSILNVRLGLWIGNPGEVRQDDVGSKPSWRKVRIPSYFWPVATSGIFGFGYHSKATFVELSDGGHFENLGLYELVRRELDLIVVVDAEQDSGISLSGLVSSRNRIKEDFNTTITFNDNKGAEILIGQKSDKYPSGALIARSPYLVAEIHYPTKKGVLVYIKSTMTNELDFATKGYRSANPDFPHQSTADQFFDPDQFEAYRDLGKASGARMIKDLELSKNFEKLDEILAAYMKTV